MRTRRWIGSALGCVAFLTSSLPPALADGNTNVCAIANLPKVDFDGKVDLRNGSVAFARKRFKTGDTVGILFVNRNPFRYEYSVSVEEKATAEPALELFLGAIFRPLGDLGKLSAGGAPQATDTSTAKAVR